MEYSLESDLHKSSDIVHKVRSSRSYAQNLYAALCNNQFVKNDVWPILKEEYWHCSWRYAGEIVADIREEGDYLDWYCSGMEWIEHQNESSSPVAEGVITDEISNDLLKIGWAVAPKYK